MDTITDFDTALALADAVRTGRRTATDVTREHLARIAELDPQLNAFASVRSAGALADAGAVDAHPRRESLPLAGIPVVIKDNMAIVGEPVRHGSAATDPSPAAEDDLLVTRLRDAGAVILGTTRMPELAAWAFTSSTAYGVTRNPLDPSRDPGGSSGGAAAAVASGMAALAVGTDGGGSIRIPAAFCGLVGHKPSTGAVPLPGGRAEHWHGLSVAGPLARTAADAAAASAVLSGGTFTPVAVPDRLRIATSVRSPSPIGRPDQHQRTAVERAAALLNALGHQVRAADPRYPATLLNVWSASWLAGIAEDVETLGLDPALLEPRTRAMAKRGRRGPADAQPWRVRVAEFFSDHDVLVMPVTARTAGPAGCLNGKGYAATYLASARAVPLCQAWNLAGTPAVVVPVGRRGGIPLAVQLVGSWGQDDLLLALAATIENHDPV